MPSDPTEEHERGIPRDLLSNHLFQRRSSLVPRDVLKTSAKAALIGAAAVGTGVAVFPKITHAQADYTERPGTRNPFDGIDVGDKSTTQLADFDGDGDLDIAVGRAEGTVAYFENTGSASNPSYTQRTGSDNPFDGFDVGSNAVVEFGDVDGDGDLDLVAGKGAGTLLYFENTGSATNPTYQQRTGSDNPFNGFDVGDDSAPRLADFDGDGDLDAVVGRADGTLAYLENTGSANSPSYTQRTGSDNPFDGLDAGNDSVPGLADVDRDGDLDIAVGKNLSGTSNSIAYFENTGTANNPTYEQRTGSDNPFDGFAGVDSAPVFGDVDGDGDLDVPVGTRDGQIRYLENTGDLTRTPNYSDATDNPFSGLDAGINSAPDLADLDADGDLDALVGKSEGTLAYFENTGSASDPTYEQRTGSNNPASGFDFNSESAPLFVDFDGDGDFDVAVGRGDGTVGYLENTGTATNPSFTERTGSNNPFDGFDVGNDAKLAQSDLDGDGDLDLAAGKQSESAGIAYFENTGSATNPSYQQRTGSENPFSGIDVGSNSAPDLDDVDLDGDVDALVGRGDGSTVYLENTGSKTTPNLVKRTGSNNPLSNVSTPDRTVPRFADLDQDADPDLVLGTENGTVDVYQFGSSDVLPVELTNFSVHADGNSALLTWTTASEQNNSGFEIHRMLGDKASNQSGLYEVLGFVKGAGTTDTPQSYRFRTKSLSAGTHRFRLKQIDLDGSAEYSETKIVEITIESSYKLGAPFPNPTHGSAQFSLTVEKAQNVQIEIFDLLGRQVATVFEGSMSAQQKQTFSIGKGMAPGTYFLEVEGERFSASKKFVVSQ